MGNVGQAIGRIFTPGGGEAPEAVQQREAAQARMDLQAAQAKAAPAPPTMPTVQPPSPPVFSPGQAPGQKQRAQLTASTMLGAAAAGGETARAGLGTGRGTKTVLG